MTNTLPRLPLSAKWFALPLLLLTLAVLPTSAGERTATPAQSTDAPPSLTNLKERAAEQFPFLAKVPRVREHSGDYVVLVHGFTWARATLRSLGRHLHDEGFHTIEIHYPSRSIPVDEVVQRFIAPAIARHCTDPKRKVHFVAHSMGCIMVRRLLAGAGPESELPNLGRVVLLAAPNKGTEVASFFGNMPLIGSVLGNAVREIGIEPESVPNQLGGVDFAPGIIMGTRSDFPLMPKLLEGEDDGVVRVESGEVEGMAELIKLPTTHIRMPQSRAVRAQIRHFLRNGRFKTGS